jgi:hypothetical protein
MKSLKDDIFSLKKDIVSLSNRFDHRLQAMSTALEADYKQRMDNIELSYQALSSLSKQICVAQSVSANPSEQVNNDHDGSSTAAIPKEAREDSVKTATPKQSPEYVQDMGISAATISESPGSATSRTCSNEIEIESPSLRTQVMTPLMTLSGIATAMMNNASEQ